MEKWERILQTQMSSNPPRLSVDEAIIIYDES